MIANILVVEETEEFGSLILNALEETERYQVSLAMNADEAIEIGDRENIHLLIIDFDLSGADAQTCIRRIQSTNPDMAIIAIPPNNDPNDPALSSLQIRGLLTKPFYLPELTQIVSEALDRPTQAVEMEQIQEPIPQEDHFSEISDSSKPWLSDADQASHYLARLSSETSADALILLRHGQRWAETGEITPSQAEELASKITEHGVGEGTRGAITTLTRMPGTQRDCILYANGLIQNLILALIYPSGTSFGIIRRQARNVADSLKYTDIADHEEIRPAETVATSETTPTPAQVEEIASFEEAFEVEPDIQEMPFFDDLDLPPPEPNGAPALSSEGEPQEAAATPVIPGDWVPDRPKPDSHLPFLDEGAFPGTDSAQAAQEHIPLPDVEYYLPVTAVLVPRFPEHRLTGALAKNLHDWVVRLCLAWDWRADEVLIEPDYLCLTMSISPETAPLNAVLRLQDDLSQRILSAFPEFVEDLPSRRFWARSHLLITGGPPSAERLRDFVETTRRGQGIDI